MLEERGRLGERGWAHATAGLGLVEPDAAQAATPAPRPIVTGWIPYWDTADGVDAVVANADLRIRQVANGLPTVRRTSPGYHLSLGGVI